MKLVIKNLGPIKDANIELGDITTLLGFPNTGKSYTLRALYGKLACLDVNVLMQVIENTIGSILRDVVSRFDRDASEAVAIFVELYGAESIETIVNKIKEHVNIDVRLQVEGELQKIALNRLESIDLDGIRDMFDREFDRVLDTLLPVGDETKIKILDFYLPDVFSILFGSLDFPVEYRYEYESKYDRPLVTQPLIKIKLNVEINNDRLEINTHTEIFLDVLHSELNRRSRRYLLWKIHRAFRDFNFEIQEKFIKKQLFKVKEKLIQPLSPDVQSVIFIPFGRTPIVYFVDEEPLLIVENPLFDSYIKNLEKGRKKLSKGDNVILPLFYPVLQGEILYDKTTKKVRYQKWNAPDIPMSVSSALASEVSGILLPLLNAPPNSLIIIEEPESQLHYSAQILMTLTLVALSKKFGHKIVFSTHSDLFAIMLAYLSELNYNENDILKLIKELLKIQGIEVEDEKIKPLAQAVSIERDFKTKFYYYQPTPKGIEVVSKNTNEIMKDVPGITVISDVLMSWVLNLGGDSECTD